MARDAIHDAVKNALTKDGWTITAEFLQIEYEELEIFADLVAERKPIVAEKPGQRIIVEVKTFAGRSFIRELQHALGQYDLYAEIIELSKVKSDRNHELFTAVCRYFFFEICTQISADSHR